MVGTVSLISIIDKVISCCCKPYHSLLLLLFAFKMPPPPPDFLPNNLRPRRQLDPTRHLQSRELWNKVRFHAPTDGSSNNSSLSGKYYQSLINAILYEIQPFRIKPTFRRMRTFLLEEDGFKRSLVSCVERIKSLSVLILQCVNYLYQFARNLSYESIRQFFQSNLFRYSLLTCFGLYVYGRILIYMHDWLHAGPMVFLLTLIVLLYTIGLGDNTGATSGVPSAYSVFNRGVQRLLGQDDAETLANQFVHAAAGRGLNAGGGVGRNAQVGQIWMDDGEPIEDDAPLNEQETINERRRRRRLERLQQRNEVDNVEDETQDIQEDNRNIPEGVDNYDVDIEPEVRLLDSEQISNIASRKSGKKARRRNLELRREMQRQRQAAAAMGFGADDDANGGVNLIDMNAMDQLVD